MKSFFCCLLCFLCSAALLHPQTIREKKASLQRRGGDLGPEMERLLSEINREKREKKEQLRELYRSLQQAWEGGASEQTLEELSGEVKQLKRGIDALDARWRSLIGSELQSEGYALWQQPDTTIEQLVIDFGSQDWVYLMPLEIAEKKVSIESSLPIPRSSWSEMLELVLTQNGIGIRQLNPFLRELYLFEEKGASVRKITGKREELMLYPDEERVAFVLSPDPQEIKRAWLFLQEFVNPKTTQLKQIGRDIFLVGSVRELNDLLNLYDFVGSQQMEKEYKLVPLSRIKSEEIAKVLLAMFGQMGESLPGKAELTGASSREGGAAFQEANGLKIVVVSELSQAVFLIGTKEEIALAEEMIEQIESQIGGARQKVLHWYSIKYSDPDELAEIMEQIYTTMIAEGIAAEEETPQISQVVNIDDDLNALEREDIRNKLYQDTYYQEGDVIIDPAPVSLDAPDRKRERRQERRRARERKHFIVDIKTGSMVMVVEKAYLPRLLEILAHLDVQKKMVQIDALIFERRVSENTNIGLNLLKIGSKASQQTINSLCWNDVGAGAANKGILEFMLSRPPRGSSSAYDLTYKFLISQEYVQINASPSVTTINQTPAEITIVEERSISSGIFIVPTAGENAQKDSFTRAQFGTTLKITPTIHMKGGFEEPFFFGEDEIRYITLETVINFDTVDSSINFNRPNVTRREVKNEVVIGDGQTVVLGGLRRMSTTDTKDSIPYLGEIPCFGKLFSTNTMSDESTELFIFITPKIIDDPCQDIERLRQEKLARRPGDLPDFLWMVNESYRCKKNRLLAGTLRMIFGREPSCYYETQEGCVGEYDGS